VPTRYLAPSAPRAARAERCRFDADYPAAWPDLVMLRAYNSAAQRLALRGDGDYQRWPRRE
jgi:hypothetical protein